MKRSLLIIAIAAIAGFTGATVFSQAPAVQPAKPAGTPTEMLKTIREQNAKLLDQQTKTLQLLDEMEKTSQAIKLLGKRS